MITRPLLRHTIVQLEEMFAAQSSDTDILQALDQELQFRNVPRAKVLLRRVKSALTSGAPQTASAQPDLFRGQTSTGRTASPVTMRPVGSLTKARGIPAPPTLAIPPMALEEAYKVLHVTADSSWSDVEQSRFKIVQLAHPDVIANLTTENRTAAQEEAKRANAAYGVLFEARSRFSRT
jgi:DnaJ-domain-containing protein 1